MNQVPCKNSERACVTSVGASRLQSLPHAIRALPPGFGLAAHMSNPDTELRRLRFDALDYGTIVLHLLKVSIVISAFSRTTEILNTD
jgi:hypothetical protein